MFGTEYASILLGICAFCPGNKETLIHIIQVLIKGYKIGVTLSLPHLTSAQVYIHVGSH